MYFRYRGAFLLNTLIKETTSHFASDFKADEVEQFFSEQDVHGGERSVQQSVEAIRVRAGHLKRDKDDISRFLNIQQTL